MHLHYFLDINVVECSTTVGCMAADLGLMVARDCCIHNPKGLAYTISGSNICYVCIGKSIWNYNPLFW